MQGVLSAGDDASGLRWVRKGFGLSDEDDRLWALGWPHMVVLTDEPDAEPPVDHAAFFKRYGNLGPMVPAVIAPRALRYFAVGAGGPVDAVNTAIADGSPLGDDEALALARKATVTHRGERMVFLLEALRGSTWVLEQVVGAFEAATDEAWRVTPIESFADGALRALPMVMLRAPTRDVERATTRLRALATRLSEAGISPTLNRAVETLQLILAPEAKDLWNLHLVSPEQAAAVVSIAVPAYTKMKPGDWTPANGRIAFLGGAPVLTTLATHVKQLRGEEQKRLLVHLSRCAHPAVVTIMETVSGTYAKRWLAARGAANGDAPSATVAKAARPPRARKPSTASQPAKAAKAAKAGNAAKASKPATASKPTRRR